MKDVHVTLYDVAARAGVSAATASRALSGQTVSKGNRAAVEKAAADLGYVPNEAARSLRVVRTMTVGMVFHDLTSRLGIELLGALTSGLDTMGYSLFVSTAQGDPARYDQLVRRFLERRVDALVCVHGRGDGAALERYQAAGIPAISLISQGGGYDRLPLITSGIEAAAREAIADLIARGHRRLGIVTHDRPVRLLDTVGSVARQSGVEVVGIPAQADGLPQALTAPDAPSAVFALQAEAVRLLAGGLEVPRRVSLVAIRDRSQNPAPTPVALATIHVDPSQVATAATEALRRWFDHKAPLTGKLTVEAGVWRPAGSISSL